jgi:glycosyltransferase involved in cell wall biosynthesis
MAYSLVMVPVESPIPPQGKTVSESPAAHQPKVSVIVPTKNVERTMERCLRSIAAQSWGNVELVVVDNFSTDSTFEVAQQYADTAVQAGPERSAQRNLAIDLATGDYILWIDADMVLTPRVIEDAMDYALARDLTGVFIPEVTVGDGFWTACRALERKCYVGVEMIEAPRLIKRSWFVENGGFVADVAGQEDAELRMRMLDQGVPMGHIETYILHDEGRMTFADIMRKRYYYGKSLPAYNRAQPGAISKQGAATLQAMVKGLPILAGDPVHGAALVGLRACEAVAYAAGAASVNLTNRRAA